MEMFSFLNVRFSEIWLNKFIIDRVKLKLNKIK